MEENPKADFARVCIKHQVSRLPCLRSTSSLKWTSKKLDNAVNQTRKELATRFDFKGIITEILLEKERSQLTAQDAGHLRGLREMLIGKLSKRRRGLANIEQDEPAISSVGHARQELKIQQGLEGNKAKEIIQAIKSTRFQGAKSTAGSADFE